MATVAGCFSCVDTGGVLGNDVVVAVAATGCTGNCLAVGMVAGDGIVAGRATEPGMSGMTKFSRIDKVFTSDQLLISVACDTGDIFAYAVAERIISPLCLASGCNTGDKEQHDGHAVLRKK